MVANRVLQKSILLVAPHTPQVYVAQQLVLGLQACFTSSKVAVYTMTQHFHHFDGLPCELTDELSKQSPLMMIYIGHSYFLNASLLTELDQSNSPTYWVNAHFDPDDLADWLRSPASQKTLTNLFNAVFYEHVEDLSALRQLGFKPEQLALVENLKYDCAGARPWQIDQARRVLKTCFAQSDRIIVAGSVAAGQESDLIIRTFVQLMQQHPMLKLVLAPRDLTNIKELGQRLCARNLNFCHSSQINQQDPSVLLIDEVGILKGLYYCADIAIMGRSFYQPTCGGSNILEPAAAALPIIVGPYYDDDQAMLAPFSRCDAITHLTHAEALLPHLEYALNNPKIATHIGRRAQRVYQGLGGGIAETCGLLHTMNSVLY